MFFWGFEKGLSYRNLMDLNTWGHSSVGFSSSWPFVLVLLWLLESSLLTLPGVSAGAAPPPARPPAGAGRTGGAGGRGWVLRAEPLAGPPPPPGGRAGGGGVGGGAGGPGSLHSSALVPSTHTATGVCVVLGAELYIQSSCPNQAKKSSINSFRIFVTSMTKCEHSRCGDVRY